MFKVTKINKSIRNTVYATSVTFIKDNTVYVLDSYMEYLYLTNITENKIVDVRKGGMFDFTTRAFYHFSKGYTNSNVREDEFMNALESCGLSFDADPTTVQSTLAAINIRDKVNDILKQIECIIKDRKSCEEELQMYKSALKDYGYLCYTVVDEDDDEEEIEELNEFDLKERINDIEDTITTLDKKRDDIYNLLTHINI